MTTSFENTIRSLQANDPRKVFIGLLVGIILAVIWLIWFLFAQIPLYEVSDPLQITLVDILTVDFPVEAQGKIKQGQEATLTLDGDIGLEIGSITGYVFEVEQNSGRPQAHILINWSAMPYLEQIEGKTGHIQVKTEELSPISLVLRSARSAVRRNTK